MRYGGWLRAGLRTLWNVVVHGATRGRYVYLEGRWRRGRYHNWSFDRQHRSLLLLPTSEEELGEIIGAARRVRVVGAGHSFNDGLVSDGVNVSLDDLSGVVAIDRAARTVTAWAGTRLRDLNRELASAGLALRSLASHDAQSIGGIVSTDVHGTGRLPAHLSDAVLGMHVVDGRGELHDVGPDDDLFRAAVGGMGAVGVITRLTIQCVDTFHLRQRTIVETRGWAVENLGELLTRTDHVSFYAYPFTTLLHAHTWQATRAPRAILGPVREFVHHAAAALAASFLGDRYAHSKELPGCAERVIAAQPASDLVLRSHHAFNRTLYHLHQELELAVPAEEVWDALDAVLGIYEDLYPDHDLPFLLVEVRFTPAGHDVTLLGPGVGRPSAWLCLCLNQSGDVDAYFDAVEAWMVGSDARPHLGKWSETWSAEQLAGWHGDRFERFQAVRSAHDPDGRFTNRFTERVLGPVR